MKNWELIKKTARGQEGGSSIVQSWKKFMWKNLLFCETDIGFVSTKALLCFGYKNSSRVQVRRGLGKNPDCTPISKLNSCRDNLSGCNRFKSTPMAKCAIVKWGFISLAEFFLEVFSYLILNVFFPWLFRSLVRTHRSPHYSGRSIENCVINAYEQRPQRGWLKEDKENPGYERIFVLML